MMQKTVVSSTQLAVSRLRLRLHCTRSLSDPIQKFYRSAMITLDKVIRYNFVPAIRFSFEPARKEERFCTCTAPKLYRSGVKVREKEHFCIGSKVIRYSVNVALMTFESAQNNTSCWLKFMQRGAT